VEKSDLALILQCQKGCTSSFRDLYRRHHAKIRSTLYPLCGASRLDDLVQEVFLRVWQGLPHLREPRYFSTWLYRITWNVAQDERRKLGRSPVMVPADATLNSSQAGPDLMHLHYQDLVGRALQTLSLEHRVVLVLHDLEDLPQKAIAEILELPAGTVKSRLFYARRSVRQYLKSEGVDDAFSL
jgi:RNA polymerase sigma-70 factor (ECF subfamily)